MKTILVANQKGGVGKTLIVDELAFLMEKDEIAFSLYDLDQQGGLLHIPNTDEKAQVTLVDTPGALQEDLTKWIEEADFIIVPTLMSNRDLAPLERMISILAPYQGKKPILYILNRWNHYNMTKDFCSWFENNYPELKTAILSESTAFNQASARQISVQDYNSKCAGAKQLLEIYGYIKAELNLKEGWRK